MKRTFVAVITSVMLALVFIPASVDITATHVTVTRSVASAAKECVPLSVGVNKSTDKEVCGDTANGGVIISYLKEILKFLSGGVGIVILLMLTVAGIQYMTAAGQPEQVKAAKNRIQNALTGLVLFLIAFAVLNLIIPGSIFGK